MKFQKGRNGKTVRNIINTGKGLTEQSHKHETDINFILEDYKRTGFMKHAKENQGKYDDISVQDFQTAIFQVTEAQNMFNELPGHVRKRFQNNPAEFLDFVQNPENKPEMQKLGILRGNDGIDMSGVATDAPVIDKPVPPVTPPVTPETPE